MKKEIDIYKFLEEKTLYFNKINIDTVFEAWQYLKPFAKPKYVIHLIGTNGKGSTGRILATYLQKLGKKVLHYSSPHIMEFRERIWIDGKDSSNEVLQEAHQKLLEILPNKLIDNLSYFEYTTLLALLLSDEKDFLVLEAGLGGEYDATNVIKADLSLLTTIDYDHMEFLGSSIESIVTTKVNSVDKALIVAKQIHDEVYDIAKSVVENKNQKFFKIDDFPIARKNYTIFTQEFLNTNLQTVLAALEYMDIEIDLEIFKDIIIVGRCQKIAANITIDVGHNPLGAKVLAKEFANQKVILLYNTLKDKDYKTVLKTLKPIIEYVLIIPIDDVRALSLEVLQQTLKELDIKYEIFSSLPKEKEILVFGSFKVVEEFLKIYQR
ncbi:MAG: Mur ligase family protein [Arcobacteraceae bacterium]|nr:Mur ligase family protein [Arcobacteraceae bacterium]